METSGHDDVLIWKVQLKSYSHYAKSLRRFLSDDEILRAHRFHYSRDETQYILRHGILRIILGLYLEKDPHEIRFRNILNGKPRLSLREGGADLRFNMSHSRDIVLYAFAIGREVGVDIEYVDFSFNFEPIVIQFFKPHEVDSIMNLPKIERREAFYRCWVRKEAVAKAMGSGIYCELDHVEYSAYDQSNPVSTSGLSVHNNNDTSGSVKELVPNPGFVSAIAADGVSFDFRLWETPLDILSTRSWKRETLMDS